MMAATPPHFSLTRKGAGLVFVSGQLAFADGGGTNYQRELTAYGAASGMAAGAATNDYSYDLVTYGPRRVVDRCMAERGHTILNDIGRG